MATEVTHRIIPNPTDPIQSCTLITGVWIQTNKTKTTCSTETDCLLWHYLSIRICLVGIGLKLVPEVLEMELGTMWHSDHDVSWQWHGCFLPSFAVDQMLAVDIRLVVISETNL